MLHGDTNTATMVSMKLYNKVTQNSLYNYTNHCLCYTEKIYKKGVYHFSKRCSPSLLTVFSNGILLYKNSIMQQNKLSIQHEIT